MKYSPVNLPNKALDGLTMAQQHSHPSSIAKSMTGHRRWIAYFDLLGVKSLINSGQLVNVVNIYESAVADLEKIVGTKEIHGIHSMWFSDTFIIYADDDTPKSFAWLEQAARLFFDRLILSAVPVRGAISIGELYTNRKNGVIVGDALLSAYKYGEAQDWIGLLITPATVAWLYDNDLNPNERLNYAKLDDVNVLPCVSNIEVFAYRMSGTVPDLDRQQIYRTLKKLKDMAPKKAKAKYERSLRFIDANKLRSRS